MKTHSIIHITDQPLKLHEGDVLDRIRFIVSEDQPNAIEIESATVTIKNCMVMHGKVMR